MAKTPETTLIRAIVPIEADHVRIETGDEAPIRNELVADLIRAGAAEVVTASPNPET